MSQELAPHRRRFLRTAAMAIAAAPFRGLASSMQLPIEGDLPALRGATTWLNSDPLSKTELHGRVAVVNFWTYSCVNWRRSLPYVRAWAERYKEHGLVTIGAHSPEFAFEHNIDNVRQAAKVMMIDYPIVIDNDYAIWRAFNNEFWPALYFVDGKGRIRHHKFGECDYDQSEAVIQQLLRETGAKGPGAGLASVAATGPEVGADWFDLRSGENYLGFERTENFASPHGMVNNKAHTYDFPQELKLNHWALGGDWTAAKQLVQSNAANSRLAYQFHARDLHLVIGSAALAAPVRFRVLIDGQVPGAARGSDIDGQANGTVAEPRMYHLIRQPKPIVDRRFEIEFFSQGVEAYSITFG